MCEEGCIENKTENSVLYKHNLMMPDKASQLVAYIHIPIYGNKIPECHSEQPEEPNPHNSLIKLIWRFSKCSHNF